MELLASHIPQELMLPTDGPIRLPVPSVTGRFLVTPDELWNQLVYGDHNPGYGNKPLDGVIEQVEVKGTFVEVLGLPFGCKDTTPRAVVGVPRSCLGVT